MKNKNANKTRLSIVLGVAWILSMGTGAALAGEITGNGKWIAGSKDAPLNGNSECAYSGQQDDAAADAGFFRGDRVQSWGQIPKAFRDFLKSIGSNPGVACNPKKSGG